MRGRLDETREIGGALCHAAMEHKHKHKDADGDGELAAAGAADAEAHRVRLSAPAGSASVRNAVRNLRIVPAYRVWTSGVRSAASR